MHGNITSSVFFGAAITLTLVYIMQLLIALQPGAEVTPRQPWNLVWVAPQRPDDTVQTLDPVPPEPIPDPPALPQTASSARSSSVTVGVHTPPTTPTSTAFTGTFGLMTDGPLVALVRVKPGYPARALTQGLEGYVIVQFDVGVDGTVNNVTVVESSHSVFENSAIKAAERFRFKPRIVDGIAVPTTGIRNLFRFEMNG